MPKCQKNAQKCPEGNTNPLGNSNIVTNNTDSSANASESTPKRERLFCFTYYPREGIPPLPPFLPNMSWLFYGKEYCPSTKRLHYQGACYIPNKSTAKALAKKLFNTHVKICNGDVQDQIDYCSKGEQSHEEFDELRCYGPNYGKNASISEFGKRPQQGERTDLHQAAEQVLAGRSVDDIVIENPTIGHQYARTLDRIETIVRNKKQRDFMTIGIWVFGETNKGKTASVFQFIKKHNYSWYKHEIDDKGWWDGYEQQDVVILNDFRGGIPYAKLLNLVDRYPERVPQRGKKPMSFISSYFIINSPLRPEEVYNNLAATDSISQLLRRFIIIDRNQINYIDFDKILDNILIPDWLYK